MTTASLAVGIVAAITTRGALAWRDARARRHDEPLEARIARAVARAEAEAAAQDRLLAERRAA